MAKTVVAADQNEEQLDMATKVVDVATQGHEHNGGVVAVAREKASALTGVSRTRRCMRNRRDILRQMSAF